MYEPPVILRHSPTYLQDKRTLVDESDLTLKTALSEQIREMPRPVLLFFLISTQEKVMDVPALLLGGQQRRAVWKES